MEDCVLYELWCDLVCNPIDATDTVDEQHGSLTWD